MKAKQGGLFEAEADVRRALLSRLKDLGKYHPFTVVFIRSLAGVLTTQGRHAEAEKLARAAIEVYVALGVPRNSEVMVSAYSQLATILSFQRRWTEMNQVYE